MVQDTHEKFWQFYVPWFSDQERNNACEEYEQLACWFHGYHAAVGKLLACNRNRIMPKARTVSVKTDNLSDIERKCIVQNMQCRFCDVLKDIYKWLYTLYIIMCLWTQKEHLVTTRSFLKHVLRSKFTWCVHMYIWFTDFLCRDGINMLLFVIPKQTANIIFIYIFNSTQSISCI